MLICDHKFHSDNHQAENEIYWRNGKKLKNTVKRILGSYKTLFFVCVYVCVCVDYICVLFIVCDRISEF